MEIDFCDGSATIMVMGSGKEPQPISPCGALCCCAHACLHQWHLPIVSRMLGSSSVKGVTKTMIIMSQE